MGKLDNVYSVEEVASYLGLTPREVYTALRCDDHTPPMERCLPGAWREQGRYSTEWFIPQAAVDHWRERRDSARV